MGDLHRVGHGRRLSSRVHLLLLTAVALTACAEGPSIAPTMSTEAALGNSFLPPDRAVVAALYETQRDHYTGAERMMVLAVCLENEGFAAAVRGNAIQVRVPEEQEAAFEDARANCSAEVDARFPEPEPPTPEVEYRFNLELAECLRAEGYEISQAPSFETWRDSIGNARVWHPYNDVAPLNLSQTEWDRLNMVCPQYGVG